MDSQDPQSRESELSSDSSCISADVRVDDEDGQQTEGSELTASEDESDNEPENLTVDVEEKIRLSDGVFLYPHKKLSDYTEVYVGETSSRLLGSRPCVIKRARNPQHNIREAEILRKLGSHTHVIWLYQTCRSQIFGDVYLVLEKCCDLDLYQYVTAAVDGISSNRYSVADKGVAFCKQIINGMKHVHENFVIHRDLKPHNILLTNNLDTVKIADFGSSIEVKSMTSMVYCPNTFGTIGYRPPEAFTSSYISLRTDCYSLGALFYFVLSNGKSPFGDDQHMWDYNSKHSIVEFPDLQDQQTVKHLIKYMMHAERCRRPSIWQIENHPTWIGVTGELHFDYGLAKEEENCNDAGCASATEELCNLDAEQDRRALPYIEEAANMNAPDECGHPPPSQRQGENGGVSTPRRLDLQPEIGTQTMDDEDTSELWIYLTTSIKYRRQPIRPGVQVYPAMKEHFEYEQELAVKLLADTPKHRKEIQKLLKLESHRNIIKIKDSGIYPGEPSRIFLVMERCLQNLSEYISHPGNLFILPKAMSFFQQSLSAVEFIHSRSILHLDLKPTNILIAMDNYSIKISNFNISRDIPCGRSVVTVSDHGGETGFNAPEVYRKDPQIGFKADIYSLGLCGYYSFTHGKHPFGNNADARSSKIMNNFNPDLSQLPEFVIGKGRPTPDGKNVRSELDRKDQLENLFKEMLQNDPKERPTAKKIKNDKFFISLPSHFPAMSSSVSGS